MQVNCAVSTYIICFVSRVIFGRLKCDVQNDNLFGISAGIEFLFVMQMCVHLVNIQKQTSRL